jgi:hypothetical protein
MKNLAIESDTAINKLQETDQKYMRQLVANSIQELLKNKGHKKRRKTTQGTVPYKQY